MFSSYLFIKRQHVVYESNPTFYLGPISMATYIINTRNAEGIASISDVQHFAFSPNVCNILNKETYR